MRAHQSMVSHSGKCSVSPVSESMVSSKTAQTRCPYLQLVRRPIEQVAEHPCGGFIVEADEDNRVGDDLLQLRSDRMMDHDEEINRAQSRGLAGLFGFVGKAVYPSL